MSILKRQLTEEDDTRLRRLERISEKVEQYERNRSRNINEDQLVALFTRSLIVTTGPVIQAPESPSKLSRPVSPGSPDRNQHKSEITKIFGSKRMIKTDRRNSIVDRLETLNLVRTKEKEELLEENFLDNEREYFYKSQNIIKETSFLSQKKVTKIKRVPKMSSRSQIVFTKAEVSLKKELSKLRIHEIQKGVCFQYLYNPEHYFNSMTDVISLDKKLEEESLKAQGEQAHLDHLYAPRLFKYPRDLMYSKAEFPANDIAEGSDEEGHQLKYIENKRKIDGMYITSEFFRRKPFIPFKKVSDISQFFKFPSYKNENIVEGRTRGVFRKNTTIAKKKQTIAEQFVIDMFEIDRKHLVDDNDNTCTAEMFYEGLISREHGQGAREDLNWNGEQVLSRSKYSKKRTLSVINKLNNQEYFQWIGGSYVPLRMIRKRIHEFIFSTFISNFLLFCVLANTVILMMDGLLPQSVNEVLLTLNVVFTAIFFLEFLLKIIAIGFKTYSKDLFNIFDAVIVLLSLVEVGVNFFTADNSSGSALSAFRALRILRSFRVLRVTRILRSIKFMKVIVAVVAETAEQFVYVAFLLLLFLFIYALLGMQIFGGTFPDNERLPRTNFDSFVWSFVTLFQLMTFENWVDVLEICLNSSANSILTYIFFVSWICIGNYVFFNLFLALLLGGFDSPNVMKSLQEVEDEYKQLEETLITEKQERIQESIKYSIRKKKQEDKLISLLGEENEKSTAAYDGGVEKLDLEIQALRGSYIPEREEFDDHSSIELLFERKMDCLAGKERLKKPLLYQGVNCDFSLYLFSKSSKVRVFAAQMVSHPKFEAVIIVLIVLSSLKLIVETYFDENADPAILRAFRILDYFFNAVFIFEAALKIIKMGLINDEGSYLKDNWSVMDFIIVISSIIDMSFSQINIFVIKIFRTLRPLRFISRNQNMKIIVNSLLGSLGPLLNVLIVILLVWIIFGILGMNFMGEKQQFCNIDNFYRVSKETCQTIGGEWKNRTYWNFDNIIESLVTLFVLSSLEGWPSLMGSSLDISDDPLSGPDYNNNQYILIFYLLFILISILHLTRLVVLDEPVRGSHLLPLRSGARQRTGSDLGENDTGTVQVDPDATTDF